MFPSRRKALRACVLARRVMGRTVRFRVWRVDHPPGWSSEWLAAVCEPCGRLVGYLEASRG